MGRGRFVSNEQFFKVCEHIRDGREHYTTTKPDMTAFASQVSAKMGFPISEQTAAKARKVVGVMWHVKRGPGAGILGQKQRQRNAAVVRLITALTEAYLDLSQQVGNKPNLSVVEAAADLQRIQAEV